MGRPSVGARFYDIEKVAMRRVQSGPGRRPDRGTLCIVRGEGKISCGAKFWQTST